MLLNKTTARASNQSSVTPRGSDLAGLCFRSGRRRYSHGAMIMSRCVVGISPNVNQDSAAISRRLQRKCEANKHVRLNMCAISEPDTPLPRLPLQESMCKECLDYKRRCLALGLSGMCYDQPDFRSYKGIESRGIIKRKEESLEERVRRKSFEC